MSNNIKKYNDKLNVIGNKIRFYRERNNLSLVDLSNKLILLGIDIPKNSLQRLEHGKRVIIDFELAGFAKDLNISTDDLLKDFIDTL